MNEFVRYICVGTINFLVCVLTIWYLAWLGIHYTIYTAIGYALAIICSFFLNLKFTFKNSQYSQQRLIKFISFSMCNLLVVEGIEIFLIQYLQYKEVVAVIIGMAWYTISGFLVNKFFVYQSYEKNNYLCG